MTLACGACGKDFILHEDSKETIIICEKCGRQHKLEFDTKLAYSELICGCGTYIYFEGKGGHKFFSDKKRYDLMMQNRTREGLNKPDR